MAIVQRANVYLEVSDNLLDYYVGIGYNVLDDNGNVIRATVPTDLATLQNAYREHEAKIKELEATIEMLKQNSAKSVKNDVQSVENVVDEEIVEKKKRTRKKTEKVEE